MADDRQTKAVMRQLWTTRVANESHSFVDLDRPLYLTMCGPAGAEIELLIEKGVLRRTETQSVVEEDLRKIVAIESSPLAQLELLRRFPGLNVIRQSVEAMLRGGHPESWPDGVNEQYCRALIVNLDFSQPLKALLTEGEVTFPVVDWIATLAKVHAKNPPNDWILFVTLHGGIVWDENLAQQIQQFLAANFDRDPHFAAAAQILLGQALYAAIIRPDPVDWDSLSVPDQQRILMVLLPKKVAHVLHRLGWLVETVNNYKYGGEGGRAPMVAWVLELHWDTRAKRTPDVVYQESLQHVLDRTGTIEEDGTIS
jgi:hypothetical protein